MKAILLFAVIAILLVSGCTKITPEKVEELKTFCEEKGGFFDDNYFDNSYNICLTIDEEGIGHRYTIHWNDEYNFSFLKEM